MRCRIFKFQAADTVVNSTRSGRHSPDAGSKVGGRREMAPGDLQFVTREKYCALAELGYEVRGTKVAVKGGSSHMLPPGWAARRREIVPQEGNRLVALPVG